MSTASTDAAIPEGAERIDLTLNEPMNQFLAQWMQLVTLLREEPGADRRPPEFQKSILAVGIHFAILGTLLPELLCAAAEGQLPNELALRVQQAAQEIATSTRVVDRSGGDVAAEFLLVKV